MAEENGGSLSFGRICAKLYPARYRSTELGAKLELPDDLVKDVREGNEDDSVRLEKVVMETLTRRPELTRIDIIEALRSAEVGMSDLADTLQVALGLYPSSALSQSSIIPDSTSEDVYKELPSYSDVIDIRNVDILNSSEEVEAVIESLHRRFKFLKYEAIKCLEKQKIPVYEVADVLTSPSVEDCSNTRMFLESHIHQLACVTTHAEIFLLMNFHWNYLDPSKLHQLVKELKLDDVKNKMEAYNTDLKLFMEKTPLKYFSQVQSMKRVPHRSPSQEMLTNIIARFNWSHVLMMLEDVEEFRQRYASHYNLPDLTVILCQLLPG